MGVTSLIERARLAVRAGVSVLTATDGRDVLLNSPDGWEVEQPWLWWNGPAGSNGSGGPFGNPIPGASPWIQWGGIPAVARATSLIVDTLAALPWKVLRERVRLPDPDWLTDPGMLRLDGRVLGTADVSQCRWSRTDFRAQWLTSALWFGDGYIYVPARDATGAPKPPLYVLHPDDVRIEDGGYFAADYEIPAENLIHLRGLGPIVKGHGTGVLTRFASELGYSLTLKNYAAGVFASGVPNGYLKVTAPGLAQDKADALKSRWLAAHGGSSRSIAVLNATTEFHPLTFSPVDAALVEVVKEHRTELANAFGIPGTFIGAPSDNNTYANIESRRLDLNTFTFMPWSSRIEAVLDAQLPRGTSLKVDLNALARGDIPARIAYYAAGQAGGWLFRDEIRDFEDLPPITAAVEDEVAVA